MSSANWEALSGLAIAVTGLITWFLHSRTGSHSSTRKGDQ